jgi:hypothetical protein
MCVAASIVDRAARCAVRAWHARGTLPTEGSHDRRRDTPDKDNPSVTGGRTDPPAERKAATKPPPDDDPLGTSVPRSDDPTAPADAGPCPA